jgi:S-adenosylmethionine synthetase
VITLRDTNHNRPRVVTSEAVADGHPDKLCDQISDAVLDACLTQDPGSRVAVETAFKGHTVMLLGEITTTARPDYATIVRRVLAEVGHEGGRWGLDPEKVRVLVEISEQEPEIGHAVGYEDGDVGAGDQGLMFGYADAGGDGLMPLSYALARALMLRQREVRLTPEGEILGPDAKSQVTIAFSNGDPLGIEAVVLSSQHVDGATLAEVQAVLRERIADTVLPSELVKPWTKFYLNPSGSFVHGGPVADAGVTGRKIIADSYGGVAHHGGGAFSGKDATKVDRSAAYAARQIARTIVAAGAARRCEVHVAYAIGIAEPVAIDVETFGTGVVPDETLAERIYPIVAPSLKPREIIRRLDLRRPIFRATAAFGHFGRFDVALPWEAPHAELAAALAAIARVT